MPTRSREVLLLVGVAGLDILDAADICGITPALHGGAVNDWRPVIAVLGIACLTEAVSQALRAALTQ